MTAVTETVTDAEHIARRLRTEIDGRCVFHGGRGSTRSTRETPLGQYLASNAALLTDAVGGLIENGDICPTRTDTGIVIPHDLFDAVLAGLAERRECGCLDCGEGYRCEDVREPDALYWRWWALGPEAAAYARSGDQPDPTAEDSHVPSNGQPTPDADGSPACRGDGPTGGAQ